MEAQEVESEIELHFMDEDELPKTKRIDPDVRIVQIKREGELLIENGFGDEEGKVVIGVGGLKLKLNQTDFNIAYFDYITRKLRQTESKDINSSKDSK